jgi:hypothetical protein
MKRLALCVLVLLIASSASAQSRAGSTRPAQDRPGISAFGIFDQLTIASSKTFDAVFGTSSTRAAGAGAEVQNIWRHVFLRVAASKATITGERVVVVNSTVYRLGTKLTVDMQPTEAGAGWRFVSKNSRGRFVPYVGAAVVFLSYKETSDFADAGENVAETFKGYGVFGGVDVKVARQLFLGVEAQHRSIKTTPSANSAAASFSETDFGGTVLRLKAGLRF